MHVSALQSCKLHIIANCFPKPKVVVQLMIFISQVPDHSSPATALEESRGRSLIYKQWIINEEQISSFCKYIFISLWHDLKLEAAFEGWEFIIKVNCSW